MIRDVSEQRARRSADRIGARCADVIDAASDSIVLSFAGWTILYLVSMVTQTSMLWAGWPWIVVTALVVAVRGMRVWTSSPTPIGDCTTRASTLPANRGLVVGGSVVLALALLGNRVWGVWPVAAWVIIVLTAQLRPLLRSSLPGRSEDATARRVSVQDPAIQPTEPGWRSHLFAAGISIAFGVLGAFLLRPDADDAFYVNRATWVATNGTAALNDTMFSPDTLPLAGGGGLPTPSVEAAQGVLAHALGIQAATFCYLFAVPVLGALSGWTTWRLVRQWAARRWALAMAAAMLFILASGASIIGNYSIGRIWQGKATAFCILLPLVWLYLSRIARFVRSGDLVILGASGVAFVGLTTTSALVAPVVVGAALLAALLLRSSALALGSLTFAIAPLLNGLIQVLGPAAISGGGNSPMILQPGAFTLAFNTSAPMALLGILALAWVPQLTRSRVGVLIGCGALVTMVTLLPGLFDLVDSVTGAGAVAWRLAVAMPTWVLVGLLVTLPLSTAENRTGQLKRLGAIAAATATLMVPLVSGTWLWDYSNASLTRRPTWKVDQAALADVRAAQRLKVPGGLWLMPADQMEILAISSVDPFAVVPRGYYLPTLNVPPQELRDRVILFRLVTGRAVAVADVRKALVRLDVSLACVSATDERAQRTLRRATGSKLTSVSGMRCHLADR